MDSSSFERKGKGDITKVSNHLTSSVHIQEGTLDPGFCSAVQGFEDKTLQIAI